MCVSNGVDANEEVMIDTVVKLSKLTGVVCEGGVPQVRALGINRGGGGGASIVRNRLTDALYHMEICSRVRSVASQAATKHYHLLK